MGQRDARPVTLAALAVVTAVALAACGGGHTATRQDVIARGNAICAGALREIRAVPPPAVAAASLPALAGYLTRVVPILEREIAQMKALPRPATDRALLDRYVAALASTGSRYRELSAAAHAGNSEAVSQSLAALAASPAAPLAARYGLGQCATATGTAVS